MTKQIDLNQYGQFVLALTSLPSKDLTTMINRLNQLDSNHDPDVNVPLFVTSAMGMCSETGEFMEIAKKCLWQGKELTEDVRWHLMRELGDIQFYWTQACLALQLDPNEVIAGNVEKLRARYPGGEFTVYLSENRKAGDL